MQWVPKIHWKRAHWLETRWMIINQSLFLWHFWVWIMNEYKNWLKKYRKLEWSIFLRSNNFQHLPFMIAQHSIKIVPLFFPINPKHILLNNQLAIPHGPRHPIIDMFLSPSHNSPLPHPQRNNPFFPQNKIIPPPSSPFPLPLPLPLNNCPYNKIFPYFFNF